MLFFLNTIATDYLLLQFLDIPENHVPYLRLHKKAYFMLNSQIVPEFGSKINLGFNFLYYKALQVLFLEQ